MTITPEDLLQLAGVLRSNGMESHQRAASSRGYYAAYHACLSFASKRGYVRNRGKGSHDSLITFLQEYEGSPTDPKSAIHQMGVFHRQVYGLRILADYQLNADFKTRHANEAVSGSQRIVARVRELESRS